MSQQVYIVTFHHRHGNDVWPVFSHERPDIDKIIEELEADDNWDGEERGEYLDITGPFENPLAAPLRDMVDSYDDTGCEECGVVDESSYKAGKKALA